MSVHIYAPQPSHTDAVTDFDCPGPAGDGRKCGSYHALGKFTPWHGWSIVCCACGSTFAEGYRCGRVSDVARVRSEFEAVRP